MKEYAICCADFTVVVRQESLGWIWTIEGTSVTYAVLQPDESAAKTAGIEAAKAMLRRRGLPVPNCLSKPEWISRDAMPDRGKTRR